MAQFLVGFIFFLAAFCFNRKGSGFSLFVISVFFFFFLDLNGAKAPSKLERAMRVGSVDGKL